MEVITMRGRGGMGGMRGPGPRGPRGGMGGMRGPGPRGPLLGPLWMRPRWGWFPGMWRRGCGCLLPVLGVVVVLGLAFLELALVQ